MLRMFMSLKLVSLNVLVRHLRTSFRRRYQILEEKIILELWTV